MGPVQVQQMPFRVRNMEMTYYYRSAGGSSTDAVPQG